MTFRAPAPVASVVGPSLIAHQFQVFRRNWGMDPISSVAFPHSNCRSELAVKSSKRLIRENVGSRGELDCDKFDRALLQQRNTPIHNQSLAGKMSQIY